jgi:hypothetical protein
MTYAEQKPEASNRRFRMRDITIGQNMAIIGGVCVLVFGAYFLFSALQRMAHQRAYAAPS